MDNLFNDNNVFILGAGFSREAELPLINDFLNIMRDALPWLIEKGRTNEAKAIETVLNYRLKASSAAYRMNLNLDNIEDLFSLASTESGNIVDSIRLSLAATIDFSKKVSKLNSSIRIYGGIEYLEKQTKADNLIKINLNQGYFFISLYEYFLSVISGKIYPESDGENSIITFNYDTLAEEACKSLQIDFQYGFKKSTNNSALKILKLHGSINWYLNGENDNEIENYQNYQTLLEKEKIPFLVPPIWNKEITKNLKNIWTNSIESISNATRIIIIGFSAPATDTHFKYLLSAGLKNNISLREIYIVDKNIDKITKRYKDLFNNDMIERTNVKFIKSDTRNFFMNPQNLHSINRYPKKGNVSISYK